MRTFSKALWARRNTRAQGISLIEGVLVILLGVFVVLTVIGYFSKGQSTVQVSQALQQIQAISGNVRAFYAGQVPNYPQTGSQPLNNQNAIDAGFYTDTMIQSNTEVANPWGGAVDVIPDGDTFFIVYRGIPSNACAQLASQVASAFSGQSGNLVDVMVSSGQNAGPSDTMTSPPGWGTVTRQNGNSDQLAGVRVNPTRAAATCSGNANGVAWELR